MTDKLFLCSKLKLSTSLINPVCSKKRFSKGFPIGKAEIISELEADEKSKR